MTPNEQRMMQVIDENREKVHKIAKKIWEFKEVGWEEFQSSALLENALEKEGFEVQRGLVGKHPKFDQEIDMPTAFKAVYKGKEGGPVIGLMLEYDALPNGHACGHNLIAASGFSAALGLKEAFKDIGSVIVYGTPAEELEGSKHYIVEAGYMDEVDLMLANHYGGNWGSEVTGKAIVWPTHDNWLTFKGRTAHASSAPEQGRSALDAVELMNVGVQFLREHMPRDARVHYSILDAGGVSPNVVQHQASVLYMIRSNFVKDCMALHQRVDKIAQGAALMTDTTIERRFVDGLSDTVCNHALEKVLYDNFSQLGVPPCTAEEHAFMEALSATYEGRDFPGGVGAENDPAFAEKVKAMQTGHFNDFLMPLYQGPAFNAGSTDVGDVSYQCPTAQIHVAVWPNHVPCHSWQVVSCNKTPMAHKATVHAGKVLCAAAIDLLEQPALLEAAKAEFRQRTAGGYTCPIPPDAVPAPLEL